MAVSIGAAATAQVRVDFQQLRLAALALGHAPADLRRVVRKAMRAIGQVAQRAMKAEFGPRMTDRTTRRRADRGERLGRFSGRGRSSVTVRAREWSGGWKIFVGPRGGAGAPGPGFYLAFHEFGYSKFPRRPIAAPADARVRPVAEERLADTVNHVLRGW